MCYMMSSSMTVWLLSDNIKLDVNSELENKI